jgi:hypothetical protein
MESSVGDVNSLLSSSMHYVRFATYFVVPYDTPQFMATSDLVHAPPVLILHAFALVFQQVRFALYWYDDITL